MNVILNLLDHPTRENREFADSLILGVFRNSLCELIEDNFGKIQMNQPSTFMATLMIDFSTITVYSTSGRGDFSFSIGRKIFKLCPNLVLREVDYEEDRVKDYLEELILEMIN